MARRLKSGRSFGFTLLEMMIVIIIMGILLSIAIPIYSQSIMRARESVLRNDLAELNKLVQQYTLDKQKAPQSLEDLVSAGYIHQVPKDPMTGETNWDTPQCEVLESIDQQDPGICQVHSASTAMSTEGTAYNTWE
ncbi:MAG TPA: prepilin-type N-terminal cleavage/methylation domain-containing protein [Verrucomicrobiae bacterium]|jgi:general secretion pathway protein G|nr:prepilin-type N-terminal cleavage/methylation domain-containing protein [Verrucomicrobiae bacterium]